MCDKSRNTWLYVHWQWNTLEWCLLNALQASPVVHLVTPLSCVSLSMNTQPSVPTIDSCAGLWTSCACHLWLLAEAYWFSVMSFSKWFLAWSVESLVSRFQTSVMHNLCAWIEAYWFLAMSLPKWPPGSYIESSGSGLGRMVSRV